MARALTAFLPVPPFPRPAHPATPACRNPPTMATGPHKVGILDCRLPPSHSPTIRLRVYYPTAAPSSTSAPWLPNHPSTHDQSQNILSFLSLPALVRPLLRPILTNLSQQPLPATHAPPVLPGPLPVALFSHGLGGSTGGYATFCANLASHGRLVLAPEHCDGSAFVAYRDDTRVAYTPHSPARHGAERAFRARQLDLRLADLRRVLACLRAGDPFVPLDPAARAPRFAPAQELIACGHSFGAATALLFGAEARAESVVCLDAWLYPVPDLTAVQLGEAHCLFVDMGHGMKQSVVKRRELARPRGGGVVDAVAIRGGLHNNSSDFPVRLPLWIAVAAGMTRRGSDPAAILEMQSVVVEEFLGGLERWRRFRETLVEEPPEGEEREGMVVIAPVGRARSMAVVSK